MPVALPKYTWTETDLEFLRENASKKTAKEIGDAIGKTRWSVLYKAKSTGISLWRPDKKDSVQSGSLSEPERAYLAAIIDGEGMITVNNIGGRRANELRPSIAVANTSEPIISYVRSLFDKLGLKSIYMRHSVKGNRRPLMSLVILGHGRILAVLEAIEPYLIGKRKQADLVKEFVRSRLDRGITSKGWAPYNLRELEIWKEVKAINMKGFGHQDFLPASYGSRGFVSASSR